MKRDELVEYLDTYLQTHAMQDRSNNGLQVEGADEVTRVAFAVDVAQGTIDEAVASGAQMLIVHHGLFWGQPLKIVGPHRRRVGALLEANCSLYAVHLPLDSHPEVGNNVQLARLLGLMMTGYFDEHYGVAIGVLADAPEGLTRDALAGRMAAQLGQEPLVLAGGPEHVRRVAIVSGGASASAIPAVQAGCDTFITGETSHSHYHNATEYGINVLYGGHYATETVGLKALQEHLATQLGLPGVFIDRPTGL